MRLLIFFSIGLIVHATRDGVDWSGANGEAGYIKKNHNKKGLQKNDTSDKQVKVRANGKTKTVIDNGIPKKKNKLDMSEMKGRDIEKMEKFSLQFFPEETPLNFNKKQSKAKKNKGKKAIYGEDSQGGSLNMIQTEEGEFIGSASTKKAVYHFQMESNGDTTVTKTNQKDFPQEIDLEPANESRKLKGASTRDMITDNSGKRQLDDGSVLDVLVVYTKEAMCDKATENRTSCVENHGPIKNHIDLMIQETNQAFYNSKINTQLNLVHTYMDKDYVESGDFTAYMNDFIRKTDGQLDSVHALRNQYRADLVQLVVSSGWACGIAQGGYPEFNEAWGFFVVRMDCAVGYYSYAHELGHNMGCNHDFKWARDKNDTPAYGYVDDKETMRSIMAYDCNYGCPRLQYFSNPDVSVLGKPFGTKDSNNAARINSVLSIIANYRQNNYLATKYSGTYMGHGNMFDVRAKSTNLNVVGMDVHLFTSSSTQVLVYTHEDASYRTSGWKEWQLVGSVNVVDSVYGKTTKLPVSLLGSGLTINAGKSRAFLVLTTSRKLMYSKSLSDEGSVIASDTEMEITNGKTTNYDSDKNPPFSSMYEYPTDHNGGIFYEVMG